MCDPDYNINKLDDTSFETPISIGKKVELSRKIKVMSKVQLEKIKNFLKENLPKIFTDSSLELEIKIENLNDNECGLLNKFIEDLSLN